MTHWFYVGLYHGNFYPLTKSPLVDQLLSHDHLHQLIHLNDYAQSREVRRTYFPDEQVLAYTLLLPRQDRFGRNGVWNYTVLFTFHDYLQYLDLQQDLFIPPPPLHDAPQLDVMV